jgi:glycosyltransferase involved in cell wall biosynthesis
MKISIITVCLNSEGTIRDTIDSVISQDYSPIEYIIIDGDSTDATLDVVREFGNDVSLIISEPDGGIYDAMNRGIKLASGDIIGFLNSDDFYSSSSSLTQVMEVFRNTSTMSCYGDLCYVDKQDTSKINRYWKSSQFIPGNFSRGWCPPHPTFFVRSEIYQKYGDFDLSYKIAADIELMMRFLEHQSIPVEYIPEILVNMRMGGETNKSVKNIFLQNIEIWNALKQHDLKPTLFGFTSGKVFSRSKQYITRPSF